MSATFIANGYVDIRIKLVDKEVYGSQSLGIEDVADLIKNEYENKIGRCELIDMKIMIEKR